MNMRSWIHGLVSAAIGGGANAVTLIILDPIKFNVHEEWRNLATATLVSGILAAALYLKKSPIPDDDAEPPPPPQAPVYNPAKLPLILFAILSIGLMGCGSPGGPTVTVSPEDEAEARAEAASKWVSNASGLLETGVAAVVQIGIYSANKDNPEETARAVDLAHIVSANLFNLITDQKTDPEEVRIACKIDEPYFNTIFSGVANLYAAQYAKFKGNGYADFSIELLKAVLFGIEAGTAK